MKNQTERLVVGAAALLVGLLLGWMVRGVATYNAKAAMVTPYDDWRVACPAAQTKDSSCEMSADIIDAQRNSAIARVTITRDKDGKNLIGFMLPHGVALEAGMGLQIGKDPVKVFPYRTCNSAGCIATAPFDDKLAASLKGASDAKLLFATLDGKRVDEPMSFKGYNKAHSVWRSQEAKRHNWFWRLFS
ncbi:MAG TPA: invasion associated locus B family protein [Rhizomicrobium sp.]|jgi:invasion protein IalB|nr:invasion associated locus B family protein [Rhizomicrobium sp.]